MKNLKPVTFINNRYNYHSKNELQQRLLMKALLVTQDPKKLRDMSGAKSVAEVYRTFDKLANSKKLHAAFEDAGLTFDKAAGVIMSEMLGAEKSADRLKGVQIFLKAMGVDKYANEDGQSGDGNWEELLERAASNKGLIEGELVIEDAIGEYEVKHPEVPDSVKRMKEDELETARSLYE